MTSAQRAARTRILEIAGVIGMGDAKALVAAGVIYTIESADADAVQLTTAEILTLWRQDLAWRVWG